MATFKEARRLAAVCGFQNSARVLFHSKKKSYKNYENQNVRNIGRGEGQHG